MISIIIPSYNKPELLKNCITSIISSKSNDFEVIIIDNGSTDPLYFNDQSIHYINLESNHGFSKAINIGIKQAKGNIIAVLNNDTEVDSNWIGSIVSAFKNNPDIMFITSKIKSLKDKNFLDDVGDVVLSSGKVYKLGNREKDAGQYDQQRYVFGASGCASIYRREFFDSVGYFDEDFFAYLEDVDLSFRANLQGYKCLYLPDAIVYHVGSATSGSQYNDFTAFHLAQNTISMIVKNFSIRILINSIFAIFTHIISLQAFFIIKGYGISYFKGLICGIKSINKMLKKRREIMSRRVLTDYEIKKMFKMNKRLYRTSKNNRSR